MMTFASAPSTPSGQAPLRAWLQLARIPNLATAWADVLMGFIVTHDSFAAWPVLLVLLVASSALYMAGMVLNDVFDVDIDRVERPQRPIPSGRITLHAARRGGILLLAAGMMLAWLATVMVGDWRPGLAGTTLAMAVLLYDGALKKTPIAPLIMGSCRFLNVLLGMSAASEPWHPMLGLIAGGLGLYIAGVTWYARTEARESNRGQLLWGVAVMAAGLGLLAWFPLWRDAELPAVSQPIFASPERWRLAIALLGGMICWRALQGVAQPVPWRVQRAVKQAILSLIMFDAAIAYLFRDFEGALPILLLIIPALWLGKRIYST